MGGLTVLFVVSLVTDDPTGRAAHHRAYHRSGAAITTAGHRRTNRRAASRADRRANYGTLMTLKGVTPTKKQHGRTSRQQ